MSAPVRLVFRTAHSVTYAHRDGALSNGNGVSGEWHLTGAVEYGRGYARDKVVRRYTLEDVLEGRVPWFYKNGKQRCHPTDLDHGTSRVWVSPPLVSVSRG